MKKRMNELSSEHCSIEKCSNSCMQTPNYYFSQINYSELSFVVILSCFINSEYSLENITFYRCVSSFPVELNEINWSSSHRR